MRSSYRYFACIAGALLLTGLPAAYATEYNWNNPAGGNLSDVSNWDVRPDEYYNWDEWGEPATTAPGLPDQLWFQADNPYYDPDLAETALSYTVSLDEYENFAAADFIVNGSDVTLQLNSGQLILADHPDYISNDDLYLPDGGGNLIVGAFNSYQPGSLTLADGEVSAFETFVGFNYMTEASLNLADNTQLNTDKLIVGGESDSIGTLNLLGESSDLSSYEAIVGYAYESTGTVNLDRGQWNSDILYVGFMGNGTVNVTEGQLSAQEISLGLFHDSVGTLNISGNPDTGEPDSAGYGADGIGRLDTDILSLGIEGEGHLNISAGGQVVTGWTQAGGYNYWATGSITVSGPDSRFESGRLDLGLEGSGSLSVTNGGYAATGDAFVGSVFQFGESATGEVSVAGPDSMLAAHYLTIGNGSVAVRDSGMLQGGFALVGEVADGSIEIDGGLLEYYQLTAGSYGGNGAVTVGSLSSVHLEELRLGADHLSSGSFLVNGDDSLISIGDTAIVGAEGDGTLQVSGQSFMTVGRLEIGSQYIGDGSGTVTIANGAEVHADIVRLGATNYSHENSQLNIESDATLRIAGDIPRERYGLIVSDGGRLNINGGQLNFDRGNRVAIEHDAQLNINSGALDGEYSSNVMIEVKYDGQLNVNAEGSMLNVTGVDIDNGASMSVTGVVASNSGTGTRIVVHDGGLLQAGGEIDARISNSGTVLADGNLQGTVTNNGLFQADGLILGTVFNGLEGVFEGTGHIQGSVFNEGEFNPGNSAGLMTIDGSYEQSAVGSLLIELAGHEAGISFDRLEVSDDVLLDGQLIVALLDSFLPEVGDSFEILSAGMLIDTEFSQLILPELTAGMEWALDYNVGAYNVMLSVKASVVPVPGAVWLFASALGLLGWRRRRAA